MPAATPILRALARAVPKSHALAALLGTQGVRIAVYHHIADREHSLVAGLGVTTPPALLAAHLDFFQRHYDIIALDDVLRGRLPRRPLLITFDDPFRSILESAAPLLKQRGLPALHFVNAGCIASGEPLPEHLVNHLIPLHGVDKVAAALLLDPAQCRSQGDVISTLTLDGWRSVNRRLASTFGIDLVALARDSGLYMTPAHVKEWAAQGFEVGNHTAHHLPGRVLDEPAAQEEIVAAGKQLEAWCGQRVRAYAQPFGNGADVTNVVRAALTAAGTEAAFLVHGVANRRAGEKRALRVFDRVGFAGEPVGELFLRLEILPRLRAARDRLRGSRRSAVSIEAMA